MTIERRPRQFLAVWSDDGSSVKGSTFEESLYVDGSFWKNELSSVPLDGFKAFGEMFSSGLQAQHDQLAEDKANLTTDLAAKTTEYDTTKAALDNLTSDMAALVAAHKTALDAKEAEFATANAKIATLTSETTTQAATIATLQADNATKQTALDTANATIAARDATIAALEARIALLLTELPFNPRIIDATAFYSRITKDEFAALSVADDETLRTIAKTILAYKTNDWPVIFESLEFQGLIGYLVGTAFLTAERAAQLTTDATRAEAYDAA